MTTPSIDPAQTFWIGKGHRAVFLRLHPARGRDCAVLLCPPFGFAEASAYRNLRTGAATLAEAGFPAARLSLPGTGNSGGLPGDCGMFGAWLDAVTRSASWLRETTGARRLVALGVGLGGFLAALAAQRAAEIDDLILWGVPSRGRALVRQERAYAGLVANPGARQGTEAAIDAGLQLGGYLLTDETAQALSDVQLDPQSLPDPLGRRVLLLGRDGLAVDTVLEDGYRAVGAHVDVHRSEWLNLIGEPEQTVGPARTFERVAAWLRADGAPSPAPRSTRIVVSARTHAIVDEAGRVRERALHFGGEAAGIYGVLSEPVGIESAAVVGVWVGPFRRFVEIGRRWAARGVPTVRVDLMGSGESDGQEPHPLTDSWMYSSDREPHLPAVLDQLVASRVGTHFIVGGYCAGAYWALQAALSDPRVISAMLINLYAIRFSRALAAERETAWTLERVSSRAWRRLSHRELTATRVRRGMRKLYAGYVRGAAARPLEETQRMEWARALSDLREREADLLLMLGRNEPLLEEFRRQGLLDHLGRWPNLTVEQMPGNDHLLWQLESQHQLHHAVDEALERTLAARRRRER